MATERGVPSYDPELFEDVDGGPAGLAPSPAATAGPPAAPTAADPHPVTPEAQPEAPESGERSAVAFVAPDHDEVAHPQPLTRVGQLYRSAGASGTLAALARPALAEPRQPDRPASSRSAKPVAPVAVVAVTGWGQPAVHDVSAADAAINPAREGSAPATPRERASRNAGMLGRRTFGAIGQRASDGLLLATDGITLLGELALVGAAALMGALIDLVLGTGVFLPVLTLLAAWFGAFRIRPSETAMAFAVPPILYVGVGLVVGQLSLPAGRHLMTREALLLVNLLPSAFPWLIVLLAGTGVITWLRARTARAQVAP